MMECQTLSGSIVHPPNNPLVIIDASNDGILSLGSVPPVMFDGSNEIRSLFHIAIVIFDVSNEGISDGIKENCELDFIPLIFDASTDGVRHPFPFLTLPLIHIHAYDSPSRM